MKLYVLSFTKEREIFKPEFFLTSEAAYERMLQLIKEDGSNYDWQIHSVDLPSNITEAIFREKKLSYICEDIEDRLNTRLEDAKEEGKKLKHEQNIQKILNKKEAISHLATCIQENLDDNEAYFDAYWASVDYILKKAHLGKE